MVGTGDPKYQSLADETKLPEDRQKTCANDYTDASEGWDAALMPHLRAPDQPKAKIDVVYGEGEGDLDVVAQGLRSFGLLEIIRERMASAYAWPEPFTIEGQLAAFSTRRGSQIRASLLCATNWPRISPTSITTTARRGRAAGRAGRDHWRTPRW
jgi:hypothetical protein